MREATDWDLWNTGLIDGPEPRGHRSPGELAAMSVGKLSAEPAKQPIDRPRTTRPSSFSVNGSASVRPDYALTGPSPRRGILKEGAKAMTTTLTEREVQRNMRAVAHAIAQQELEGLTVSDATVADLNRAARGEIDTDEVIGNIHSRIPNVPLLRQ